MKKDTNQNKKKISLNGYINGKDANGIFRAFVVFAVLMFLMGFSLNYVGLEGAQEFVKSTGVWAPIAFVFICFLSTVVAPLSGSALYATAGALFGWQLGFVYSLIALSLGCSFNFWLSRRYGRKLIVKLVHPDKIEKIDKMTGDVSKGGLVVMFLIMLFSSDFASYVAGLTKVRYKYFLIIQLIESSLGVAGYIFLGTGFWNWLLG